MVYHHQLFKSIKSCW